MQEITCGTTAFETSLDDNYWNNQYQNNTTGWDLGEISPPIKTYVDTLTNKWVRILIPGCGNTYEADYLLQKGFTNITVIDIAPLLVERLQQKYNGNKNIHVIAGDFFKHDGTYDVIIEQTFFCALPPMLRQKYVYKMHQLLADNGLLVGLLFNRTFQQSPPFGGSKEEYLNLFKGTFYVVKFDSCTNSAAPRADTELWIQLQKNDKVIVTLYKFEGITCNSSMGTVIQKIAALPNIINVSMSSDFTDLLIVSEQQVGLQHLQNTIEYDAKYSIGSQN